MARETVGEAWVKIRPDVDGLAAEAEGAARGALGKIAAVAGGALVAVGVKDQVGKLISGASDLQESMSKNAAVFKEDAAGIEAWASTSATAMGQTKQQAIEAAASYGNLFQAFGLGREPARDMSKGLTELATDLASFNNTTVAEALAALQSGVSGETEPLKRYGIAINDVRLKEEAFRLGLIKSTKDALTPAAKAQASYALIMADTSLAQGDFARTSDGLANKQKILSATVGDLRAKLGSALLPIVTRVVGALADNLGPAVEKVQATFRTFAGSGIVTQLSAVFARVAAGVRVAVGVFERFGAAARQVMDVLRTVAPYVAAAVVGYLAFQKVVAVIAALKAFAAALALVKVALLANPIGLFVAGVAVAAVALVQLYRRSESFRAAIDGLVVKAREFAAVFVDRVRPVIAEVTAFVVAKAGEMVQFFREKMPEIREAVGHVMVAIETIVRTVWGVLSTIFASAPFLTIVRAVFDTMTGVIDGALQIIQGVISTVLALINGDWGAAWDAVKQILSGALDVVLSVLEGFARLLWEVLKVAWAGLLWTIENVVPGVLSFVAGLPDKILRALGNLAFFLAGKGLELMAGLQEGLTAAWLTAAIWVSGIPGRIVGAVGDVASTLWGVGKSIVDGLLQGLKDGWHRVTGWLSDQMDRLPGVARRVLGINSPSTVFAAIGGHTVDGLRQGLARAFPAVMTDMARYTALLSVGPQPGVSVGSAGMQPAGGLSPGANGGGAVVTIENVHMSDPLTMEAFTRSLAASIGGRL